MLAHGIIDSRRKKKVADQGKAKSTAQSVEREGCMWWFYCSLAAGTGAGFL